MFKLSHVLVILVMTSIVSSWLTATVVAQDPIQKAFNRTVYITSGMGSCSGVILQTNLIMTAAHCITGKNTKVDGKEAVVAKIDTDGDLAMLYAETIVIDRILVSNLKVGDDVFTWGYPFSSPNKVFSKGYVAVIQMDSSYTTNMAVPGQSGSGLFDRQGNLIGIITNHMDGTKFSVNRLPVQIRDFWRVQ